MAGSSSLDLSPNHSRNFTADSSTRWTSGRLCFESLESLLCVSTTNTPKQKSLCVHKLRQLVSGLYLFSVFHSIFCVGVLYLVEKQSERCAGSNCRPESWSMADAVTAMKPQLTSADNCDCVGVLCVCLCRIAELQQGSECYSDISGPVILFCCSSFRLLKQMRTV